MPSTPLTCGSLFSGVGGFDLGLSRAGFEHKFFAEIDPYCRAVLATRFPGVPIYEDVKDVGADAGHVDILAGGFPCQDLSVAGKRAGLDGARSGLFFEFARIIGAIRPRSVLLENVEGLYSSGSPRGADFGIILDTLAELGYVVSWRSLDAQHFGVPQRRRRVFVCAIADGDLGAERIGEVFALTESSSGDSPTRDPSWPRTAAAVGGSAAGGERIIPAVTAKWAKGSGGPAGDECQNLVWPDMPIGVNPSNTDVAGALVTNAQGGQRTTDIAGAYVCAIGFSHTQGLDAQPTKDATPTLRRNGGGMAMQRGPAVRRLTPMECERLMGWPDNWTDVPWNKKDHSPDSRRYAACGNGVVAPVAHWIGARLAEVLR